MLKKLHIKCRKEFYASSNIKRFFVPDEKVSWEVKYDDYAPPDYTGVFDKPWTDKNLDDPSFQPKWNTMDGAVNRQSYTGSYAINPMGYPLNPNGRTGIKGRGILGRWGPNHAADPIITRWKRNDLGEIEINNKSGKKQLQFVGIQRRDTKEWAIPGGMVDPNEVITTTLKREFMEEALNSMEKSQEEIEKLKSSINDLFKRGDEIYKGYVDDPRNTDNAWMETCAFNFHDDDGKTTGSISLVSGDDAIGVRWIDIGKDLNLYANHSHFIELIVEKLNGHW